MFTLPLALSTPGWPEILMILMVVLVLFGAKRLPELARGIGQSIKEFKKAREEIDKEIHTTADELKIEEPKHKQQHNVS